MDNTNTKREPVIRISHDQMEAFIMLPLIGIDESYTLEEVLSAAERNKVVFGIDTDAVTNMINERVFGSEVLFARGEKAIDGKDGYYDFNFDYDLNKRPKVREDGSVDYWRS